MRNRAAAGQQDSRDLDQRMDRQVRWRGMRCGLPLMVSGGSPMPVGVKWVGFASCGPKATTCLEKASDEKRGKS